MPAAMDDPDDPATGGAGGAGSDPAPDSSEPFDPLDDPLIRLERNERSTRHAVYFLVAAVAFVVLLALLLRLSLDLEAQPCPDHGQMCTSSARVELVVIPTAASLAGAAFAMWQTYRRWRQHVRWRPWLFVSQIMWLVTTGYMLTSASTVFVGS